MPLQIPDEQIPKIGKIRNLSDAQVEDLIEALKSAPIEPIPDAMAKRIAKHIRSIPKKDLVGIVEVIYELYFVREFANVSQSRFLGDLIESVRESKHPDLALSANEETKFKNKIERLLNIEAINAVSKSVRLQRDGERLYCTSKILSDIRPVFKDDATARPIGAVITHSIKLAYHEGGQVKEFFVVLDSEDLGALGEVLDRAIAKDKTLRELLKATNILELGL
jgi:hypothetical protein